MTISGDLQRRFDDESRVRVRVLPKDHMKRFIQGSGVPQDRRTYCALISVNERELFLTRAEVEAVREMLNEALADSVEVSNAD